MVLGVTSRRLSPAANRLLVFSDFSAITWAGQGGAQSARVSVAQCNMD